MSAITAEALGVPEIFNAATHFVDRNVADGRGGHVAIECGDARITYDEVLRHVNRCGSALRGIGVRPEDRVLLLLLDGPEFVYSFFGAIKIGAVPVPLNTLWKPADYQYVIRDSRAAVLIVSAELLANIERIPDADRRSLRHIILVRGAEAAQTYPEFALFESQGSAELEAEPTSRDAPAFWLYSSGSTGAPKGCVHLQHDMVVCAELFGKGVLGIRPADRCFSVAKLFFAYGLGNALYFPFAVGATTILWPGPPTPQNVYAVIERHKPTLFYSVPTGYGMLLARQGRGRLRPVVDPPGGVGRRGAAGGALRSLQAALRRRHPRRHRLDRNAAHVHLEPARRDPARLERPARARLRGAAADRRRRPRAARRHRQPLDPRRLGLRRLLEPAREDEEHDRRPLDPHRRQVHAGRGRLLTGTRAAATTCSRSAACG